jgi:hypothetical protein
VNTIVVLSMDSEPVIPCEMAVGAFHRVNARHCNLHWVTVNGNGIKNQIYVLYMCLALEAGNKYCY